MSVQIDMNNYEAFYLDYLEGNLSGEALAAFEAFLAAHPELAVDDLGPEALVPEEHIAIDPLEKLVLKHGIDLADLNAETLSFFLTAREEGLLNSEQEAQLNHWLEANAHYRQDAALHALIHLEADKGVIYEHKEALKKPVGRVIPLWWTGVAAAAAGVALLITIGLKSGGDPTQTNGGTTTAGTEIPVTSGDTVKTPTQQQTLQDEENRAEKQKNRKTHETPQNGGNKKPLPVPAYRRHITQQQNVLASLEKRRVDWMHAGNKTVEPSQPLPVQNDAVHNAQPQNDMAWVPIDEMKNPIEPVTNTLSNTLNTPVDFRTAKASKRKGGGFYLKIGKLEVSHQSSSASLY